MTYRLILASQSPRRRELLGKLGVEFEVCPADIDETPYLREKPYDYCKRIARSKAEKLAALNPDAYVLAADTPVLLGRKILQTPADETEARAMFTELSGRRVYVGTAVCLITPEGKILEDISKSWLKFKPFTKAEIDAHIEDENNWRGVSGAFKIQGSAVECLVTQLHGSVSGIIGLPLYETRKLLKRAGLV